MTVSYPASAGVYWKPCPTLPANKLLNPSRARDNLAAISGRSKRCLSPALGGS